MSAEQDRTLIALEKDAKEWEQLGESGAQRTACPQLQQGLVAYATEQASLKKGYAARFAALWKAGVKEYSIDFDEGREDATEDHALVFSFGGDDSDTERIEGENADSEAEE